HQREVLRMVAAEVVEILEKEGDPVQRGEGLQPIGAGIDGTTQQTKTFLGKGKVNVVLTGEVAVNRRRAVLDSLGDLSDGDVLVALRDKQLSSGVGNAGPH